jgi:Arabinogalactan endo-1,4-beta-galactosidase
MFALTFAAVLLLCSCTPKNPDPINTDPEDQPAWEKLEFSKGADISWATEMESKGQKFYDFSGQERECTALFKSIGFNSVRFRVWVNPTERWSGREDVLEKAKRAQALGMKIMIDFHYSDWWADPGKQNVPAAWKNHTPQEMASAVASHTSDVLYNLKNNGIDVAWVQVGNEVTNGMLWESGRVKDQSADNFCSYFTAGYKAVKSIYPDAAVILHIDNGWNYETMRWYFDLMKSKNLVYDMIGLSLYPAYWENGGYPDWTPKVKQFVTNLDTCFARYGKPIMLCEFGMPEPLPAESKAALQYLMDNTKDKKFFKGIFLWEPESEPERNGYDQGAFLGGKPTVALDPFKN